MMTMFRTAKGRRTAAWAAAAGLSVLVAMPASATPLFSNLIFNPGAEANVGAANFTTTVAPAGWSTSSNFSAVQYAVGGPNDLNAADSAALGGGANYFAGGPNNGLATASQTLIIADLAASIDAGALTALFEALIGGWFTQNDNMVIQAIFRDAASVALLTMTLGPVDVTDRNLETTLLPRSASAPVPVGTRSVDILMTSTRTTTTSYNDGYADNLSFQLQEQQTSVPEPRTLALVALGILVLAALGPRATRRAT
jgi:hypothetical protein